MPRQWEEAPSLPQWAPRPLYRHLHQHIIFTITELWGASGALLLNPRTRPLPLKRLLVHTPPLSHPLALSLQVSLQALRLLTDAVGGTLATPISLPSSHWGAAPLAPCTTSDESRTVRSLH